MKVTKPQWQHKHVQRTHIGKQWKIPKLFAKNSLKLCFVLRISFWGCNMYVSTEAQREKNTNLMIK